MTDNLKPMPDETELRGAIRLDRRLDPLSGRLSGFPWWLLAIFLIAIWTAYFIFTRQNFRAAFDFIIIGISITITTTLYAFGIAIVIGLIAGLGKVSRNPLLRNIARLYVELVRGIPILVLIFYVALVAVPDISRSLGVDNDLPLNVRAIIALSITYGAFLAEIFRAGIQSIGRGQMEAARSLGMSYSQSMRYVILPQAIRNVLPALGNEFVAMVKDSSLVSVLAVRDITQVARLYAGRTFRFREAYSILAVLYLTMTLILSFVVQWIERRLDAGRR